MRTLTALLLAVLALPVGACGGGDAPGEAAGSVRASDFPAGSVPSPELSDWCRGWLHSTVIALVCDPALGDMSGVSIAVDGSTDGLNHEPGVAAFEGSPLSDGQRIEFEWTSPSSDAVAAFRATRDGIEEVVVIDPFDPPARSYEVELDGLVARVSADTGAERVIRVGGPDPQVARRDGTPEQAVESFVELMGSGKRGWGPACELLAASTRRAYETDGWECALVVGHLQSYTDNAAYPEPEASRVLDASVRRGEPTVVRVELEHRYRVDEPGQPRRKRVRAPVPVVEEDGAWRILAPDWLSPMLALSGRTQPGDAALRARLAELERLSR